MPTQKCSNYDKIIAQTLFLGASVSNFNVSKGWGGQPSQITVNLINDKTVPSCVLNASRDANRNVISGNTIRQFPPPTGLTIAIDTSIGTSADPTGREINHYHICVGITGVSGCYVDTKGDIATTGTKDEDLMLPGKVFYEFIKDHKPPNVVFSKYWLNSDPGFFGKPNRINTDGTLITYYQNDNLNLNKGYDIINTPVYFKMGDFNFGGIVQSWSSSLNSGGENYSVIINGFESVLSNCYVILDSFAGAVYSKSTAAGADNTLAGPRNYVGREGVRYDGIISEGNIPNVFNVYGFLESLGKGGFGGAKATKDGISANQIVDALSVLTSSMGTNNNAPTIFNDTSDSANYKDFGAKSAYSPFGRILVKTMQELDTYTHITENFARFGVIPPTVSYGHTENNTIPDDKYCQFLLDLSELPRTPDDYRISGPVISILDLINQITEESGFDYHISFYPASHDGTLYNVIKVHTIARLSQPRTSEIENTIKQLQCQGYPISSVNFGKEKNDTHARQMIIGGKQQRLYQAKSLRLAYSQNTYIFNPVTYQFIDFMKLGSWQPDSSRSRSPGANVSDSYHHGKIKFPAFLSTRNVDLSAVVNPNYSGFYNYDQTIQNSITSISGTFTTLDKNWSDSKNLGSNQVEMVQGNYGTAAVITQAGAPEVWGAAGGERFFPIYMDVICPFFGFRMETEITVDTGPNNNNDFRRVRPVFFDTWTGQLVIVLGLSELPLTSVDLEGFYSIKGVQSFILTENEIRAAQAGFDNFLVYSLSKTYKNDLIEMVRRAFEKKKFKEYIDDGFTVDEATEAAIDSTDWYWKLTGGNIAGAFNQTVEAAPDKGDGSATIDPEALKDLQIIHSFVSEIGKYYGKKYMVHAPSLRSYRDDEFADIVLATQVGDAYVFSGGGDLHYNYEPTNDGAWEEYGNIIDDTIAVGSKHWYNIIDDAGKIKPLVGYNVSESFDYVRHRICTLTIAKKDEYKTAQNDPFWSYDNYEYMMSLKNSTCGAGKFLLPSVEISSLGVTDYVMLEVSGYPNYSALPAMFNQWRVSGSTTSFTPLSYSSFTKSQAKDAYGSGLLDISAAPIPMKKLYATTSVDEKFIYLDPANLTHPRILIDAPGLYLGSSSNEYSKDPNRTVLSNIAIEDLSIYLHSVSPNSWDYEWIRFMLFYTSPIAGAEGMMIGNFAASANQSANFVEIAPKAAHPFFAGIPIKSNQYSYGPWTNYPYRQYDRIFVSGVNVTTSESMPPACTISTVTTDRPKAKLAIDNWILPTNVQVMEDFVPWNYGGMVFLDAAADNEIEKNLNYQAVIETAQIDIPKLPIFTLGGAFTVGMLTPPSAILESGSIKYTDYKDNESATRSFPVNPLNSGISLANPAPQTVALDYKIAKIIGTSNYTNGPIITNIQTSMGQGGISTTYHFRTYTPKLGLFNKQSNDKLRKLGTEGLKRNKKLANVEQQASNILNVQAKFLQEKRAENASFIGKDLGSKLFGWSPSTVLIGQANPYIKYIERESPYLEPTGLYSQVTGLDTRTIGPSGMRYIWIHGRDPGTTSSNINSDFLTDTQAGVALSNTIRYKSTVSLYELKEVDAQINKDHGLQSMMSIDGIFSPVSFYPTLKNSTFHYTLYDTYTCPFCSGTKKIKTDYSFKLKNGSNTKHISIELYCDKCCRGGENPVQKLTSTQTTSAATQSIETLPPYIVTSGTDISALDFIGSRSATLATTNSNTTSSASSAGVKIPINLVTLNPIVVPYGNLSNQNIQNYTGAHPDGSGIHGDLSIGVYSSGFPRRFNDRCRHSIEIVGRGAVKPKNLSIHNNIDFYAGRRFLDSPRHQPDFYNEDILLAKKIKDKEGINVTYQMNQRFLGLRGPLVMHGWGYDLEGYPIPNAADEPYELDKFNRPRRFKIKLVTGTVTKKYSEITDQTFIFRFTQSVISDLNSIISYADTPIANPDDPEAPPAPPVLEPEQAVMVSQCRFLINNNVDWVKNDFLDEFARNSHIISGLLTEGADTGLPAPFELTCEETKYEEDMENVGGFIDTTDYPNDKTNGYQGSIISKTQRWKDSSGKYQDPPSGTGKWTAKQKLKEFYLNWAERPDLWPVGPIDLRWDSNRRVWTMKSSDATIYKMVYVTLEQDLVKSEDTDETYPARAFLDDIEYSAEPLPNGYRRLVFIKDRGGYTAPRGAKLLCRYDKDSGFYEPISKQSFVVGGIINSGSSATIEMSYVQGRKAGETVPTMVVSFDNPFAFNTVSGNRGLFTFMNGKWTLTAAKEN
jgi:hypothetical protein